MQTDSEKVEIELSPVSQELLQDVNEDTRCGQPIMATIACVILTIVVAVACVVRATTSLGQYPIFLFLYAEVVMWQAIVSAFCLGCEWHKSGFWYKLGMGFMVLSMFTIATVELLNMMRYLTQIQFVLPPPAQSIML